MTETGFGLKKKRSGRLDKNWDFDAHGNLSSASIIIDIDGDGKKEILFGTKKGKLFALDGNAGLKWFYDSNEKVNDLDKWFLDSENSNSIESPPTITDINNDGSLEIIFGTELGIIYALDENGSLLWKYNAGGAIIGQSITYDLFEDKKQKIIFGCKNNRLYVLDEKGKEEWYFDSASPIQGTPTIIIKEKPCIVFGSDDGNIFCVNNKGDLIWKYKTGAKILAQPTIAKLLNDGRNQIIVGSSDNTLYVLDDAGELLWKYKTEGAILGKAIVSDINGDKKPEIVFGSCDNKVYALTKEGDKIWSYETDFWVLSEPIIEDIDGDGKKEIIIGSYDQNLYVLDSEGSYVLDYVPGLNGVIQQAGHYADIITNDPGKILGKKLWQYKTDGMIVGCCYFPDEKSIVVNTRTGKINSIRHKKE
jgi:outer membrane protein assembly factor BamB